MIPTKSLARHVLTFVLIVVITSGVARSTVAGSISLFNTGIDATGTPLSGGSTDPHWTIVSGPGITTPQAAVVVSNQSPFGLYAQDPNSRWIWVNSSGNGAINSPYDFRLTFDLTGLNPSTASITGSWGVDNVGQIELNGTTVGIGSGTLTLPNFEDGNFGVLHSFALTNGFVAGINTIDILATDLGNPGGLNVTSLVGTAQVSQAVPEPASWMAMGLGLANITLIVWRQRTLCK
jgi:PEP-CTERM motif